MENIVFVNNIDFKSKHEDLYRLFAQFGQIKRVKIFSQNFNGINYSVGYGFIQFLDEKGYKKCLSFDKNISLYNKKLQISSKKPDTPFSRSVFVFFSNSIINEEFILSYFKQHQPSKVSIVSKPTINNYGFSIVEFSTVESRDIFLYDHFRIQSYNMKSSQFANNLYTIIEPSSNLIELSIKRKNQNGAFLEKNDDLYFNQNANNFNEKSDSNSPSISFSPLGESYFENKYYERYLDLKIIHKSKEYLVNSFLASSFSLRIRQLLMENSIIEKVETRFDINGPFELISNSLLGLPIDITNKNSVFLFIAASDFGIEILKRKTYGYVFNQMTVEKAFEMNRYLCNLNVYEGPHSDYLSSNFDLILPSLNTLFSGKSKETKSELHELNFLAAILRSKLFTVKDNRKFSQILLEFIKEKDDEIENQRRKFLIQFLKMNEMDLEEAKAVIENKSLNLNQISEPIFSFLKEKSKEVTLKIQSNLFYGVTENCLFKDSSKANHGIFKRLFEIYGDNPCDLNIINFKSSSSLENIIDKNKELEFISSNTQNSWICFNFFNNPINLTAYAIKYSEDNLSDQLISWKIEGSDDFENWILIDKQLNIEHGDENDNFSMKKRMKRKKSQKTIKFKWKAYKIKTNGNENLFKFIKITQIGENSSGNYCLKINGIEFYGSIPYQLIEASYNQHQSKYQSGIFSILFDLCEGTNPIENDLLSIFSSCDAELKNLIDESFHGYWKSPPIKNAFVEIDLKQMKLELKNYSLKCHDGIENDFIKSWIIEVSNDGKKWTIVDQRENRNEYKNPFENYFWDCKSPCIDPIRYIRIVNTNDSNNVFCLANVELYGILHRP